VQTFLAEQYLAGLSERRLDELARTLLRQRAPGAGLLGLVGLPEDETLLALVAATSPEAVAEAVALVQPRVDRIVPALWHPGPPHGC
jgi:hypothetical protein